MEPQNEPVEAVGDAEEAFYEEHRQELETHLAGKSEMSWQEIYARVEPRASAGVGILNQGATCYMNSLLQVLYHTPEFRSAIYAFKYDSSQHGDASRCIPLQLQRLFAEMQLLSVVAVSTTRLTTACGMSNHVGEQHDVQELCRVLFDALGKSSVPLQHDIERLYAGRAKQYIRSCEKYDGRTYESARQETTLDLQVPIMGCKTLEEAVHKLVVPEELNGDNQWFCEDLGKKVDALKGLEFESLPVILHLQLLRFVFDLSSMRRQKLTDKLSIPLELDLHETLGMATESARYELTGMCIQFGQAGSGHYVAKVRDASTGEWIDANDKVVRAIKPEQVAALFHERSSSADESQGSRTTLALESTDAYYLVYRKISLVKTSVGDNEVPNCHSKEIFEENERLKILQRAYRVHSQLQTVRVFAPSAAALARKKYVQGKVEGLVKKDQKESEKIDDAGKIAAADEEETSKISMAKATTENCEVKEEGVGDFDPLNMLGGMGSEELYTVTAMKESETPQATNEEMQSVTVKVAKSRSVSHVLEKVLGAFVAKGENGSGWEWTATLKDLSCNDVRLCVYEASFGNVREPLDLNSSIGDSLGSQSVLILDVCSAISNLHVWKSDIFEAIVCRWDRSARGLSLDSDDLCIVRVHAEDQVPIEAESQVDLPPASQSGAEPEPEMSYDAFAEELPDLFSDCAQPVYPQNADVGRSVLVGTFRNLAKITLGLQDSTATIAIVPMTGGAAGKVLSNDDWTLARYGTVAGDILSVEELPAQSFEVQSSATYELVRNSVHFVFNHPDRPEYTEECKLTMSKDATVEELKVKIASELDLKANALHICKERGTPQIKDETKTLGQLGFSGNDSFFVGHGAPVPIGHTLLHVYLYSAEQGQIIKSSFFTFAAKGSWTVKELRNYIFDTFADWSKSSGLEALAESLIWKHLRLRDAAAGKQNAILRDEKSLRSALLGLEDGRQMSIEVLATEQELAPDDIITNVIPWLVMAETVLPKIEVIACKTQTLAEFHVLLEQRFRAILTDEVGMGDEPDDSLELAVSQNPNLVTLNLSQCTNLVWPHARLNADKAEALAKPLGELKEIRDGILIVMRFKKDAVDGAQCGKGVKGQGKGKGKEGKGKQSGKNNANADAKAGFSSVAEGAEKLAAKSKTKSKPAAVERGIHIEVMCPESAQQDNPPVPETEDA